MRIVRYSLILVLAFSLTACGVRRNLKLPDDSKSSAEHSETRSSATTSPLD